MKERPIIFSADSVRAILEGRKTQTRRVIKPSKYFHTQCKSYKHHPGGGWWGTDGDFEHQCATVGFDCPYGEPGDRLWVRETWGSAIPGWNPPKIIYRADTDPKFDQGSVSWRPSIHMPRYLSRLTLEITNIRVERVQDISDQDSIAEGIPVIDDSACPRPSIRYAALWDSINAKRGYSWASNPWVWVIEFARS